MSLWQHVRELRGRLFKSLIALIVTTIISTMLGNRIIVLLAYPIGGIDKLSSIDVTENVTVFMKVSLLSGFILALPIIVYQIIAFIVPGLTPKERRSLYIALPSALVLFIAGVTFAFLVMLPVAIPFLVDFLGIPTQPRLSNYFSFVTSLLFWIGISFETPLLVYVLAKFHIVSAEVLIKQWRIAIVVIAIVAAVVTPTPDPINMGLLMIPLTFLYLLSVLLAKLAVREDKSSLNETT